MSHYPDDKSDILLYTGVSEKTWNGAPVLPGGYACISPIYGRSRATQRQSAPRIPATDYVIQDSGAFSDSWDTRLPFGDALRRQVAHASKYAYDSQITHRATYDLLIDEVWHEGNRFKRRWSVDSASSAIDETVRAAQWLNQHRYGHSLIISAQGVDAGQYLRCVERLVPFFRDGDILGLGGWCIIGKMPRQMMTIFSETVKLAIPFAAREGINRVHIWGVIYPLALATLLSVCRDYGVVVSTDSMGVSLNPVFGQWGYGSWRDNSYLRPEQSLLGGHRVRHANLTRAWLTNFSKSVDYLSRYPADKCDFQPSRVCVVCSASLDNLRSHAKTCSARCRKSLSRSVQVDG